MAGAFARHMAGDRMDVVTGGSKPADAVSPMTIEVMGEKGIDAAFQRPTSVADAVANNPPDIIVTMGCGEQCPSAFGAKREDWNLADPAGKSINFMRKMRDEIERRVLDLTEREK